MIFVLKIIQKNDVVAIGTHGCIKRYDERIVFEAGFVEMIKRLTPKIVIVYGYANLDVFKWYESINGIVLRIPSEYELAHCSTRIL